MASEVRVGIRRLGRTRLPDGRALGLGFALLFAGLFVGTLTALIPTLAVGLGALGVAAILGIALPLVWLLVLTLVVSAIAAGSAEYFLGISQANWIPYILACFLALRGVVESWLASPGKAEASPVGMAWFAYPAILFLCVLVASSMANAIPGQQAVAAVKNYLMMWGVLVGVLSVAHIEKASTLVWRSALLVAAVQLPVVLYQRVFVSSRLTSGLSFDAISGTFGGGLMGGRSGALAMFVCVVFAYLLILFRDRHIGAAKLLGLALLLLPTLFVVEVKAVVLWLPLVAFLVFIRQIRRRPLTFVVGLVVSMALVVGVIMAYRYSYYNPSGRGQSLLTFFTHDLSYIWDPDRFNPVSREMGRISVLVHWWRESHASGVGQWLFGYGPGASRGLSSLAVGSVAAKYPFFIDLTAASVLLWDLGVIGLASFCAMLMLGATQAHALSRVKCLPDALRHQLEASAIGLVLVLSSVIYVRDTVDGSTVGFMMFFFLGLVVHARRMAVGASMNPYRGEANQDGHAVQESRGRISHYRWRTNRGRKHV